MALAPSIALLVFKRWNEIWVSSRQQSPQDDLKSPVPVPVEPELFSEPEIFEAIRIIGTGQLDVAP